MNRIETQHGNFNVYLNRPNPQEAQFHISFVDNKNKLHIIWMEHAVNKWVFLHPETLPEWVLQLEGKFNVMINQELLDEYRMMRAV